MLFDPPFLAALRHHVFASTNRYFLLSFKWILLPIVVSSLVNFAPNLKNKVLQSGRKVKIC